MLVSAHDDAFPDPNRSGLVAALSRLAGAVTAIGSIAASASFDDDVSAISALVQARSLRAQIAARDILGHHDVRVHVVGTLPRHPAILVANHLGYLDPLLVASLVRTVAIAKGEVGRWPIFGARLRELGVVFVERGDPCSGARALRGAACALESGVSVLNFPEGTTTDGRTVLPFRRGVFGLARRLGVAVVPVRIAYDDPRACWVGDQSFVPHYAWLARSVGIVARVSFGAPLVATHESADSLAARARDAVVQLAP